MFRITPNIQNRAIAGLFYRKHDEPLEAMKPLPPCLLQFCRVDFAYQDEVNFGCGQVLTAATINKDIEQNFIRRHLEADYYRFNMPGGHPSLSIVVPHDEHAPNNYINMHQIFELVHLDGRLYVNKNDSIETYSYTPSTELVTELPAPKIPVKTI